VTDIPPRRTGTATTPPPRTGAKSAPPPTNRQKAIAELIGIPMIPLSVLAAVQTVQNPDQISPFTLDVYTLEMHSAPLSEAISDLADNYPVLGAILDKVGSATPFMALTGAIMAIGVQIAENHGVLPDGMRGSIPTLISRQDLAQQIVAEAKAKSNGDGTSP